MEDGSEHPEEEVFARFAVHGRLDLGGFLQSMRALALTSSEGVSFSAVGAVTAFRDSRPAPKSGLGRLEFTQAIRAYISHAQRLRKKECELAGQHEEQKKKEAWDRSASSAALREEWLLPVCVAEVSGGCDATPLAVCLGCLGPDLSPSGAQRAPRALDGVFSRGASNREVCAWAISRIARGGRRHLANMLRGPRRGDDDARALACRALALKRPGPAFSVGMLQHPVSSTCLADAVVVQVYLRGLACTPLDVVSEEAAHLLHVRVQIDGSFAAGRLVDAELGGREGLGCQREQKRRAVEELELGEEQKLIRSVLTRVLCKDSAPSVRAAAALALGGVLRGNSGPAATAGRTEDLERDSAADSAADSTTASDEALGADSKAEAESMMALCAATRDAEWRVRLAAMSALHRLPSGRRSWAPHIQACAERLLADDHCSVRRGAVAAMASLGPAAGTRGAASLAEALARGGMKSSVVGAALACTGEAGIRRLLCLSVDESRSPQVRTAAIHGLRTTRYGPFSGLLQDATTALYALLLRDRHASVRGAALAALASLAEQHACDCDSNSDSVGFRVLHPCLFRALNDDSAIVGRAAASVLASHGPFGELLLVRALLRTKNKPKARLAAIHGLGSLGARPLRSLALAAQHDANPHVAVAAQRAVQDLQVVQQQQRLAPRNTEKKHSIPRRSPPTGAPPYPSVVPPHRL